MLLNTIGFALSGGLLSAVHSSPVARDNDGARPISWQDPSGNYFCWAAEGLTAGSQIGVATCDDSQGQSFVYNEGATSIQVSGTNLCVEFGPGLGRNGTPLRLQNCRSNGAPGQRLVATADSHVALLNGPGQCADVRDTQGPLQSWRCVSDNANQIFTFGPPPEPPLPPLPAAGFLRPLEDGSSCVYVGSGVIRQGERLVTDDCEYPNHINFTGGAPVFRDDTGNVFSLSALYGPPDLVRLASPLPEGQVVTLEGETGPFPYAVRVVLTTSDDDGGRYCMSRGNPFAEWAPCDGSLNQYWIIDPTD